LPCGSPTRLLWNHCNTRLQHSI